MEQFIQFLTNNWAMSLAFLAVLAVILYVELRQQGASAGILEPQEAVNLMNREKAIVIDTRNKDAFDKGHILGAKHIPGAELEQYVAKLEKFKKKPLIVVCQKGLSAKQVATKLKAKDFENVNVLKGGLTAWVEANLPLAKA